MQTAKGHTFSPGQISIPFSVRGHGIRDEIPAVSFSNTESRSLSGAALARKTHVTGRGAMTGYPERISCLQAPGLGNDTVFSWVNSRSRTDEAVCLSHSPCDLIHVGDGADRKLLLQMLEVEAGSAGQDLDALRLEALQVIEYR